MSLISEGGEHIEPHSCDECGELYDEASGDGYCGLCPSCADADCGECGVCESCEEAEDWPMSIIQEGCEWRVRGLADAARDEAGARLADGSDPSGHEMAYLSGVRDTLRVLAGDADPRAVRPTFRAAYERYLNDI